MTTSTVEVPTTNVLLKFGDEIITVPITCEPVDDVWAVTPSVKVPVETLLPEFTGRFTVTHRPTGNRVTTLSACILCAKLTAQRIAEINVNWQGDLSPDAVGPEIAAQIRLALAPMQNCDCSGHCVDDHCCDVEH